MPLRSLPRLLLLLSGLLLAVASPLQAQQPTAVIAAEAHLEAWSDPLASLGTLRADESVTLSATVTDTVAELNFRDGEEVEAGQLLIRLADDEAQADLLAAQALREERRNAVNRLTQLQQRNLAPRGDLEDARSRLRQVEAEIQALEARLNDYRLRAPFGGRVGFRNVSVGTLVTPGTELVTLDKLDVMKLDFTLPELTLGEISPGLALSATSAAYPDTVFGAEIASIGTRIDPVSRSVSVRALIDNPEGKLRPGMLMNVVVQREARRALVIPESALIPEGRRQFVLTLTPDDEHRVTRREVSIGARRKGEVEILTGLEAGQLVVAHGTERVRDGQPTRLLGILDDTTSVSELLRRDREAAEASG
ncbi:efflux RND transporter periplasmic adaptor subunit [Halomonas marinisediminis]|uniref:Efflux RND transporter periplasmic adaptor subunit n=1 Tax=Halomonas marinisediminis TaxID=2546095 RepID=A0ABY2DAB4_9GAMM|nr:efflux RND transporter periplasmic adaptor subunit [Halomonas marinisediminis]TDB05125.1 efflux RND transporter periplasmic adaptor subunit [Halomonas marinisediminis]